jgi:hypothetical protein
VESVLPAAERAATLVPDPPTGGGCPDRLAGSDGMPPSAGAKGERRGGRRARRVLLGALALVLLCAALGWSPLAALAARLTISPDRIIAEQRPDEIYEALVPRYAEICATSQWNKLAGGQGNPFGHAVIYLKGACRDETAPFPQLRRCDRVAVSSADPEHGAGVSVGRFFRNVNWVAIPGCALTFDGLAEPGTRVTQELLDRTVRHVVDLGVFDGVELHAPHDASTPEALGAFIAAHSTGTDFALRYARNVFCARVPLQEAQLEEAIAFLNDKNREYATGEADYNWSLFNHNCVHTVRNALAAANVVSPISVGEVKLRALLNLAVPANEFVNLALRAAEGPLEDVDAIMADGPARDALHEFGWLPQRHGALVKFLPAIPDNDLYSPEFRLFAVQSLLRMGATAATVRMMSDPVYTDLETNLRRFSEIYAGVEARHEQNADPLATVRGDPARRASRLHLDYIRAQRAETEALLEQVMALKAAQAAGADQ